MKLFFTDGHKKGEEHELSPPGISIGRELDNDVILELEGASRYHAKLEWKDSEWFLKDLGSTNGTKLNGEKITPNESVKLKKGDNIRIGKQTMCLAEKLSETTGADIPLIKPPNPLDEDKPAEPSAVTISDLGEDKEKKDAKKDDSPIMADSKSFLNFFDNKEDAEEKDFEPENKMDFFAKKDDSAPKDDSSPKKHAGLLFYVAVIGAAIILIAGFLIFQQSKDGGKPPEGDKKKIRSGAPLLLRYEKQITSSTPKHNIFRFLMEIKDGKVTITRDDLQAGLKDQPTRKIGPDKLQELEEKLQETDFMNAEQGQAGLPRAGEDKRLSLTIAFGKDFNSITVNNTSPPRAFEEAVRVLEDFSDNTLNVPTISLTPEELRKEGMDSYQRGKLLFDNYQAQNENLFKAINLLKLAIENLGSFHPEPPEYNDAYKMKEEAEQILETQVRAHERNAIKYRKLKQFSEARDEYKAIMDKTEPGSKDYNNARKKIILLEDVIRSTKK